MSVSVNAGDLRKPRHFAFHDSVSRANAWLPLVNKKARAAYLFVPRTCYSGTPTTLGAMDAESTVARNYAELIQILLDAYLRTANFLVSDVREPMTPVQPERMLLIRYVYAASPDLRAVDELVNNNQLVCSLLTERGSQRALDQNLRVQDLDSDALNRLARDALTEEDKTHVRAVMERNQVLVTELIQQRDKVSIRRLCVLCLMVCMCVYVE